jgi:hypothetical protein
MGSAVTISIGTSHTPSVRETNAAWLLRLRQDCHRLGADVVPDADDGDPEAVVDVLISPAESSGG